MPETRWKSRSEVRKGDRLVLSGQVSGINPKQQVIGVVSSVAHEGLSSVVRLQNISDKHGLKKMVELNTLNVQVEIDDGEAGAMAGVPLAPQPMPSTFAIGGRFVSID